MFQVNSLALPELTLSSLLQIYFLQSIARKFVNHSGSFPPRAEIGKETESLSSVNRRNDDIVLKLYNASLGRPTAAMRTNYQQEFEAIVNVSNYQEFLHRLGCDYTPEQMTILLRNAVRAACVKRYGGLKLMDIFGDTSHEKLPGKDVFSSTPTTWEEVNQVLLSIPSEEIRFKNRKIWIARQKELRKQEKLRKEHSAGDLVRSKDYRSMNPNQTLPKSISKNTKQWSQSEETEKGGKDVSWSGRKNWDRGSRTSPKDFDTVDQSSQPTLRSVADSDWRKR